MTAGKNSEIVRRWMAIVNAGIEPVRASAGEFWEADGDYYPARKFPESRPCHGLDELVTFVERNQDAYGRLEFVIHDLVEVGDDRVLLCLNMRAEGRTSAMKVEGDLYECCWLRHGRFFRMEDHLTLAGALRAFGFEGDTLGAVGLAGQNAPADSP